MKNWQGILLVVAIVGGLAGIVFASYQWGRYATIAEYVESDFRDTATVSKRDTLRFRDTLFLPATFKPPAIEKPAVQNAGSFITIEQAEKVNADIDTAWHYLGLALSPWEVSVDSAEYSLKYGAEISVKPFSRRTWYDLELKRAWQDTTITAHHFATVTDWRWIASAGVIGILVVCLLVLWAQA